MRLGRLTAVTICAALVGAAPAAAEPHGNAAKSQRCKMAQQHKRFVCETGDDTSVTTTCPAGYTAIWFTSFPDADLNGNHVICFDEGAAAIDDTVPAGTP